MRHMHLLRFTLTRHAAPGRRELVRCFQHQSQMSPEQPVQLSRVIRQAKDYLQSQEFSASYASPILDSVFVNQIDVIRSYMGKLIESQHPILAVARDVYQERQDLYPESNFHPDGTLAHVANSAPLASLSMGLRALIVLLVSKAIGTRQECDMMSKSAAGILSTTSLETSFSPDVAATIADKQKKLAEVTELIYAAYMLHETIVEVPSSLPSSVLDTKIGGSGSSPSEYLGMNSEALRLLQDGNDLATLMGDLLLAKSSGGLASIRNQVVTELMSDSIGDFAESQFVTPFTTTTASSLNPNDLVVLTRRNERLLGHWKSSSCPTESNEIIRNIWFRRNQLGVGSLLGHSCYCSVLIGEHEENVRNLAYKLGENFGLILQASKEISYFLRKDPSELEKEQRIIPVRVGIYSLPVIHAVQMKALSWDALDALATKGPLWNDEYLKIFRDVQRNTRAMENSMETLCSLQDDTVKVLGQLPTPSPPAVRILLDLIQGLVHPA